MVSLCLHACVLWYRRLASLQLGGFVLPADDVVACCALLTVIFGCRSQYDCFRCYHYANGAAVGR